MVLLLIMMIDGYCQSIHILEQDWLYLFPVEDRILDLVGKTIRKFTY